MQRTESSFTPFPSVFRVYEHDQIRVGEVVNGQLFMDHHLESLVRLSARHGDRFLTPGHRSVRFKNFVGILATPVLTLEILPKTDRYSPGEDTNWQLVLMDLLKACRLVRLESAGTAPLENRPGDLLDWYVRSFIDEIRSLLRHGLLHSYHSISENTGVYKGRLLLSQQLKHNLFHRERFYIQYDQYSARHPANLLIAAAIRKLRLLPLSGELQGQLKYLSDLFPEPPKSSLHKFESQPLKDPRLERYAAALTMARHILADEQPDVRVGTFRGLALLFDMNLLFEEYLFRQLLHWKTDKVKVERQQSRVFWGQNRLRPDLVLATTGDRWVLDTKWRILHSSQPSAEELRQIYVYCDYFKAKQGALIFPRTGSGQRSITQAFAPFPESNVQDRKCHLYFAQVVTSEGRLNRELGKELLAGILAYPR